MRRAGLQPGAPRSRTLPGWKPRLCGSRGCLDGPAPAPAAARTIPGRRLSRFHHPNPQQGRASCRSSSSSCCCCSLESAGGANVGHERRHPDVTSWGKKGAGRGKENSLSSFRWKAWGGGAGCFGFSEPGHGRSPAPRGLPEGAAVPKPGAPEPPASPGVGGGTSTYNWGKAREMLPFLCSLLGRRELQIGVNRILSLLFDLLHEFIWY